MKKIKTVFVAAATAPFAIGVASAQSVSAIVEVNGGGNVWTQLLSFFGLA